MNELLVVTPNGYKTSKLYSVVPANGTGDLTWVRNTTATRVNSSGLIESVGANVPRLDYSGGVTCPCILVEPQRTNNLIRSQEFDNASWTKLGLDTSGSWTNQISAPDGTTTADKIIENTANSFHGIRQTISYASNNRVTISGFFKYNSRNISLYMSDNATGDAYGIFNLQNGTFVSSSLSGSWTNASYSIENFGNGWYRCSFTATKGAGVNILGYFVLVNNSNFLFYTGDGSSFSYFWGTQLETGSTNSSYIPTTSSTQTRNADVATVTTPVGIASLIETYEDNTTNVVTPIPVTYQMSEGRIAKVVGL